jgi:multiple sugar transport system permease protein
MDSSYNSAASNRRAPLVRLKLKRRALLKFGFIAPAVAYVLLFFVYPLAQNIAISFEDYTTTSFYTGHAPFVGLANYSAVVHDPQFGASLRNTIIFTAASLFFQFGFGLGLAVFFSRRFPLNGVLRSLLLLPWLLPLVVSGSVFRWMFATENGVIDQVLVRLHLIGSPVQWLTSTSWALAAVTIVNIWVGIPFNMVILYGGLQGIPDALYEAAALDGANAWQRFRYVSLPMLRPVTLVVLTLGLIYTIKVFDVIMVVTGGGPALATQTLTIWAYNLSFTDFFFGRGAALGNILILIALAFAVFYLRTVGRGGNELASA